MFEFDEVVFTRRFDDTYRALERRLQKRTEKAVRHLLSNPEHPGLQVKPVKPGKVYWEARISRGDRLIFRPAGSACILIDVVSHDEISRYR